MPQRKSSSAKNVVRTTLSNGVTILIEPMPHVRSGAISLWLRSGARNEPAKFNGVSHFIEHMLFKGTRRRTARQIAVESDRLGGNVDAFTMMECASYQIQTLDTRCGEAFDLLADLILDPRFDAGEAKREQAVILEEMKMVEDSPDELVYERFLARFWPRHPLGRPIEGTPRTVRALTADDLRRSHRETYTASNLIVSVAGNVDAKEILALSSKYFADLAHTSQKQDIAPPVGGPTFCETVACDFEQAHVILGATCPSLVSEKKYACNVLSTILGGGLSSRLFQKIREEEGLAYNVYSDVMAFRDAGCLSVYAAVSAKNLKRTVTLVARELADLMAHPVSEEELALAKAQLLSNLHIGLESSASRASHNGHQEVLFERIITPQEIGHGIESVTAADVQALAIEMFHVRPPACLALGPLGRRSVKPEWISLNGK
jgi:predicted Zn-dependent peptidase